MEELICEYIRTGACIYWALITAGLFDLYIAHKDLERKTLEENIFE